MVQESQLPWARGLWGKQVSSQQVEGRCQEANCCPGHSARLKGECLAGPQFLNLGHEGLQRPDDPTPAILDLAPPKPLVHHPTETMSWEGHPVSWPHLCPLSSVTAKSSGSKGLQSEQKQEHTMNECYQPAGLLDPCPLQVHHTLSLTCKPHSGSHQEGLASNWSQYFCSLKGQKWEQTPTSELSAAVNL